MTEKIKKANEIQIGDTIMVEVRVDEIVHLFDEICPMIKFETRQKIYLPDDNITIINNRDAKFIDLRFKKQK
ncbi:MAG: hypothetical protein HN704_14725 [Bacteroidetes bacterium]|jgi:hypothetical protein|nr:hypothetical protein [Bacteroidota bacterium]MBT7492852.1 hypothetical protein [Bacteroidota bacterium]